MSIDLSKLSAKELYELAQRKEKEEQEATERQGKVDELKKRREAMLSEHKSVLLLTDKKIRDMQEQREKLIADHEAAVAKIDQEIQALAGQPASLTPPMANTLPPVAKPATAEKRTPEAKPEPLPKSTTKAGAAEGDTDQIKSTLRQIMNKRPYISASLLKEKLASYGVKPANFNKELEQWVRNGWFDRQGMGNYVLGKKI